MLVEIRLINMILCKIIMGNRGRVPLKKMIEFICLAQVRMNQLLHSHADLLKKIVHIKCCGLQVVY